MVVVPHCTISANPLSGNENEDEEFDLLTWVTKYCPGLTQLDGGESWLSPVYSVVTPLDVTEQLPF